MVWRGEERRENMVNEEGKVSTLHDDVVRMMERINSLLFVVKGIGSLASLLIGFIIAYSVWLHKEVDRLGERLVVVDARIQSLNDHGSQFTQSRAVRHHGQNGCHDGKRM